MATTITYKGETLTTVTNQTKTLKTAGKYMEDDVTITDISDTAAISVVDTTDTAGGTIRTITALDISDTTAVASDVASGKYFYAADGTKTAGTASGGGGGLEYETGAFTPTEDVSNYWISFSNTHTEAPFYFSIVDASGDAEDANYNSFVQYSNFHQLFGTPYITSTNSSVCACVQLRYNSSGSTLIVIYPYTDTGETSTGYSRYWAKETGIRAYTNATTRYWKANRTYKWIAVWAPST